ncbi:DNA internalization-related competence protein ComEC/Rec2 [Rhodoferax sp. OV413]|uniref:DNA internalization-related competence protein ComEC/Rec2 n=1 Tax=Rhodoferax sp. OV413 TaxID=1855285 RepID=UPI0025DD0D23|nr:DNA internalization-related competence protein ComEC/Rec2 [Rhodoferax sp. OV413]
MLFNAARILLWPRTGLALGCGLVAGVGLQVQQAALSPAPVYLLIVLLAPVLYALAAHKRIVNGWHQLAVGVAAAAFAWGLTGLRAVIFVSQALGPALEGRDLLLTGVVADMPQFSESGIRIRFAVEEALDGGQRVQLPALIDLGWYTSTYNARTDSAEPQRPPAEVSAGQRWRLQVRLKAPHGSVNPHGFDYELYLWEQGVQATGTVRSTATPAPQLLGQTWTAPVARARQEVRERIRQQVPDDRAAGLMAALVVGDQRAIDRSDWDVFRATGVSHLVSISGMHITMFAWLATAVVGRVWRRSVRLCELVPASSAGWLMGLMLATGYAVFAGWGVPAQRTCLMLAAVVTLRLVGARWPWPWVALWAAVVVLLWDPWALLQAGFWLSFVAVTILFIANSAIYSGAAGAERARAGAPFDAKNPGYRQSAARVLGGLGGMLREQWVITLALSPLVLLWFGQVSLVGLVANLFAIPWVTLVLTPLSMAGVAWPPLWALAGDAVTLLYAVLEWLAAWPWATVSLPLPPWELGVLAVLGGVLIVMPLPPALRALGLVPVLAALLWRPALPPAGEFEVLAADIGQGNAVLVQTAGHALLFDAGPRYSLESDAGNRVLLPLLKALDVRLDMVLLSHRDADHVGGAAAVLGMQPQASLLSSIEPGHPLQQLRAASRCEAGMAWEWDGVRFELLHPEAADYSASPPPKSNALSCVLRVSNRRQTALLTGDIEAPQERRLLRSPDMADKLRADLLLVPHHGSKTSSTSEFLKAVQPRLALVQAGYRNRYGHPAPPVMQRYRELGIQVLNSPQCGAARWRSAAPEGVACMRQEEPHYWRHVLANEGRHDVP